MLEKPSIEDNEIIGALKRDYGFEVTSVSFLPIGNASNTWIYSVIAPQGKYFLKLKKGGFDEASIQVSCYLHDNGIDTVLAPLSTQKNSLWGAYGEYTLILFSYIEATTASEAGLSEEQWKTFGQALGAIHAINLPDDLIGRLKKETFDSEAWPLIEKLHQRVDAGNFRDTSESAFSDFWNQKRATITKILKHAKNTGQQILRNPPQSVVCHTDIHLANVLVGTGGKIYLVDWDAAVLAPKERDLMFILGLDRAPLFFEGYGKADINELVLQYYRCDWVLQELADYGNRVFFSSDAGEETRQEAVTAIIEMFEPGDVVDQAQVS
jgi:spectinomycin phosphotransferase